MSAKSSPTLTRIARVHVDVPLAHLDRPFDYTIPEAMGDQVVAGVRVRVRFAGTLHDGFVVEVGQGSAVSGPLAPLDRLVSPEPVLGPDQIRLCRAVADHWCATFADVVRLAVPPRHAATEKATRSPWPDPQPELGADPGGPLDAIAHSAGFLSGLARGQGPRAFWQVPPVAAPVGDWAAGFTQAVAACLGGGRSALLVVPDEGDLRVLKTCLTTRFGPGTVAVLTASQGPSARYRNYLATSRGQARIVIGTRSAALAPVANCGLVAIWDDGDDLHAEPRTPYFHARDVLALRALHQQAALLVASRARTCEVQRWVESGWLVPLALGREELRRATPAVRVAGDTDQALERDPHARSVRLPAQVFTTVRAALAQGPVLVQVPRSGWAPRLACDSCHEPARCPRCHGPLGSTGRGSSVLTCQWCGSLQASFRCLACRATTLRAPQVGAARTAEELGRAFPGTRVVDSSADHTVESVTDAPAIVVATPGAEPAAPTGYAAAVLLDTQILLTRPDLRASEEALRRWLMAVGLVRPGARGGTVIAVGPSQARPLQALVRLDPATMAQRELDERREAGFPPALRLVQVEGSAEAVAALVQASRLVPEEDLLPGADTTEPLPGLDVLGPVPLQGGQQGGADDLVRMTLRVPLGGGAELVSRLKAGLAIGSARKTGPVRVRVDPADLA